jgi:hypothetical protein
MIPGDDAATIASKRERELGEHWYKRIRCSVCTRFTWFHPIALAEPVEAPEPRRSWILCQPCHRALLDEMRRSPLRSPMRMRVAMGLVAAERSPIMNARIREDREFALVMWLLALFVLFHAVIFALLFSVPR